MERIAAMRNAGLSLAAIADTLTADGTPTARGGVRWYPATVRSALLTRERERAAQAA